MQDYEIKPPAFARSVGRGRIEEAKATTAAFTKAWRLADVTLTASAY